MSNAREFELPYEEKWNGTTIRLVDGDITRFSADILVNVKVGYGPSPSHSDRFCWAGGTEVVEAYERLCNEPGLRPGRVLVTVPGLLPARTLIHALGPEQFPKTSQERRELEACVTLSMQLADHLGCGSVAFAVGAEAFCGEGGKRSAGLTLGYLKRSIAAAELPSTG
ncbi:MAG: macro domain-containing protein [Spirochaetales bacterium]